MQTTTTITHEQFKGLLDRELREFYTFLESKNKKYGNSLLSPARVFSKDTPEQRILSRMDDKYSRLMATKGMDTEDALTDIVGYYFILRIARRLQTIETPDHA